MLISHHGALARDDHSSLPKNIGDSTCCIGFMAVSVLCIVSMVTWFVWF